MSLLSLCYQRSKQDAFRKLSPISLGGRVILRPTVAGTRSLISFADPAARLCLFPTVPELRRMLSLTSPSKSSAVFDTPVDVGLYAYKTILIYSLKKYNID